MNKLKTSKSIKKRLNITSSFKLLRHRASRNHLLQKKSSKRKQNLRRIVLISLNDIVGIKLKLPYSL
uniref:50S ribosomal protein L35 n=1 Tax=Riquetophycus sp. TaxID=1897556 RepID=A0A1C9C7Z5_9FLOR|nr:ribosomal protein L35 [Riquetophycus sp.]